MLLNVEKSILIVNENICYFFLHVSITLFDSKHLNQYKAYAYKTLKKTETIKPINFTLQYCLNTNKIDHLTTNSHLHTILKIKLCKF